MNKKEFKEMLREAVKEVLAEELPKLIKKDLKEIKGLIAKQILENREVKSSTSISENKKKGLSEMFAPRQGVKQAPVTQTENPLQSLLMETSKNMRGDDFQDFGHIDSSFITPSVGHPIAPVTNVDEYGDIEEYDNSSFNIPNFGSFLNKMNESSKTRQIDA